MDNRDFWQCLETMVSILSGNNREESEGTLDMLEMEIRYPQNISEELRGDLTLIVGQLARLATRINAMD